MIIWCVKLRRGRIASRIGFLATAARAFRDRGTVLVFFLFCISNFTPPTIPRMTEIEPMEPWDLKLIWKQTLGKGG